MDSISRRSSKSLKILLTCLSIAAPPILSLGYWLWRAGARLDQVERDYTSEVARWRSSGFRRPALFGPSLPGDAWEHYRGAMESFHLAPEDGKFLGDLGFSHPPFTFPPPSELDRISASQSFSVDQVFEGLRCLEVRSDPERVLPYPSGLLQFLLFSAEAQRVAGKDAEALRRLCAVVALSDDWHRSTCLSGVGNSFQIWAAVEWRAVLSGHDLSSKELEAASQALDEMAGQRPSMLDTAQTEQLCRIRDILLFYRTRGEEITSDCRPGWRHLGTYRLLACELLNGLDKDLKAHALVEALPVHQREAEVLRLESTIDSARPRIQKYGSGYLIHPASFEYQSDALVRLHLLMMRTATAIARFEREKGAMPETLRELVPRYLPTLPVSPTTGAELVYSNGMLRLPNWGWEGEGQDEVVWTVKRR